MLKVSLVSKIISCKHYEVGKLKERKSKLIVYVLLVKIFELYIIKELVNE